jgi:hypothetical protein
MPSFALENTQMETIWLRSNPIDCVSQADNIEAILTKICRRVLDEDYGRLAIGCGEQERWVD